MDSNLLQTVLNYEIAGLSIIPTALKDKTPIVPWKDYQSRRATQEELVKWFNNSRLCPGIVTGRVSGNLELLDFDNAGELYDPWVKLVEQESHGLTQKLTIQKSQNDGRHSAYRCPATEIPGNTKLAQRGVDVTEQTLSILTELGIDPDDKAAVKKALPSIDIEVGGKGHTPKLIDGKFIVIITLIETRGEGGQFLADPSPGYKLIQGSFTEILKITAEERRVLIEAARSLNEWVDLRQVEGCGRRIPKDAQKPGDDFNERGDVAEILVKHSWEPVGARGAYQHFRRPGKDRGQSASLIDGKWLHVFSSNAYPFEPETTYSPFAVFALLECDGDFTRAASELAKLEFGSKTAGHNLSTENARESIPAKTFLPVPPTFPIDVFPTIYQQALREVQESYAVPMEVPACALLSVAGTCIGRTRGVLIKRGWIEHANLWLAIVGASGIGKSPAVRAIYRPIFETEKKWFAAYQDAYKQYRYEIEQRQVCQKKERGQLPPPPDPPVWNQLFVDDATTEALTDALAANPRGILWNRDELSGLILELDKYTGKDGGTKSRLMSAYDSGVWKVNRRDSSKKALIPNATISIFGTIQPKALPTIFSNLDAATGFLPRFIFVNAVRETPPLWTDKTVSEGAAQDLSLLVEGLLKFELNEAGEPLIIGVNREAQAIYHAWFNDKVMAPWRNTEAEIY